MHRHVLRALALAVAFLWPLRVLAATPTATTTAATSVTTSSATLNGSGVPNGEAATGWFRIDATNPGTCDDTFGTRLPSTDGTDIGAGSTSVPFSITATGLTPGVAYYFCALVGNASGTAFGAVLSFTVPGAPIAETSAASAVTSTGATLMGSANPIAASTTGWFRYGTTDPGTCDDTFGTRAPTSSGTLLGSGTSPVDYTRTITGLTPGTTYYSCAIAENAFGTSFGTVLSFTTLAIPPVVTTNAATLVTGATAQLNGAANPGGAATTGWFRYATTSPGSCSDAFGTRAPGSGGSALGAGNSATSYAVAVGGLTQATTYYFCAIGESSAGLSFGAVLTFTTPAPPLTATSAPTSITNTAATLNASATPNRAATTGWFRYAATDPGACDDSFGSRIPASSGTALGSGSAPVSYSQPLSGLSPGSTYFFCAIASNSEGMSFGAVASFTTPSAPTATTTAAALVTATGAQLNATGNPALSSATGWFRYATSAPGGCNDSFGTRAPTSSGTALGAGSSPVAYARSLTGLTPATTYYFCAIVQNGYGTSYGVLLSFTTLANPPTVATNAATLLTGTTARLNASANPGGAATTGWFRYDTTSPGTCNDVFGTRAPSSGGSDLGTGNSTVAFSQGISGLTPATSYYFCAIAQNSAGGGSGAVLSFTTPSPPAVTTSAASSVTSATALLNGSGTPNGSATTGYFRYSSVNPGSCDDSFGTRAPTAGGSTLGSGPSAVAYSQPISGLTPGTSYFYCAIASSFEGTSFGAVLSFTTASAPTAATSPATAVTTTTATLNGAATPNLNAATGWYRYAAADPGSCNDAFGTRAPTAGGTALGAGATPVAYSSAITGLLPATTYYFCAVAQNAYGTSYGSVLSFTTPAAPPAATTTDATLLTGTTAQLNATANPGGADTTGWFRFSETNPGSCNDSFGMRVPTAGGSPVGSGNTAVAFSLGITSLLPGTTFYFCAIAENAVGIAFGTVLTFTTPTPPTATTMAATVISSTTATLNGIGTPNGSATTGYFRYSSVNPGSCDDSFGSRVPAIGGSALGSGTTAVSFAQSISGLLPGTSYYFCAIASSFEGTGLGAVLSFTTATAPTAATSAATSVTTIAASLNGSASPNGAATTGWFRYSATDPGACNDSFGVRAPTSGGSVLGQGWSPVAYGRPIAGLAPGTTYYFCAIAQNTYGTSFGQILSFTTLATAPAVTSTQATLLTGTGATANGVVNPGGAATTAWFRYATASPGSCNDTFGTRAPASDGAALGAGNSPVWYSQPISGLSPGTTYYLCAVAQNSVGMAFGLVLSFTTPLPPAATTLAATSITGTGAQLNGSATPKGAQSTGYFRYGTTDPGTCDDTFGTRAPVSGGTSLGAGYSPVTYLLPLSGLSTGTTYYFCAVASSAEGTAFGSVLSFTTPSAPSVATNAATLVSSSGATLNGSADPNLDSAYGYFRYSATNPGACSDAFGTRLPSSSASDLPLGSGGDPVAFSYARTGLTAATTYYFCAIARNSYGTTFGPLLTLTTLSAAPSAVTGSASPVTGTTATLNGTSNPNGDGATAWFRFDTTSQGTCNDTFGTRAPLAGGPFLGSGTTVVPFTQDITGLTPGTTYYYCAIAQNALGTTFGTVSSFMAALPPAVTTTAATGMTTTSPTLNGSATPNGAATTGWFRYSTTDPGSCDDAFGTRTPSIGGTALGSGTSPVAFSRSLAGLVTGRIYYFCAIASNSEGTSFGAVLSFTTIGPPSATTNAATLVTSASATINGAAAPNWNAAWGYFRYSTTNPGTCSDGFGTRVPSSSASDTALGAGDSPVAYSRPLAGLLAGTRYYYCAIARNTYGTSFGAVLSFTTLATPPTVATSAATAVTSSGATLNGTANPRGDATTGWFRYALTNPGTCNDAFGTRAPLVGGSALGAGTTAVAMSQVLSGLSPGATYYYCAIAQNALGLSFGGLLAFTTTAPPTTITLPATPIGSTSATLNGSVNPNGYATTGWFRYSAVDPGACDTAFGTATGVTTLGAGTSPVALPQPITSLSPATTYYFCAIAQSAAGTSLGALLAFTTSAAPPSVTTVAAANVTDTTADLEATVNPNGDDTTGWFRFGTAHPGTCNDIFGTRLPTSGGSALGAGNAPQSLALPATGLVAGTTYYYCALASNAFGTSLGTVLSFTTASPPVTVTLAATAVDSAGATLNGQVDPNGAATTAWFRYSATDPGACDDAFGTRAPSIGGSALGSGSTAVPYSESLIGLSTGTTYYFCAIGQSVLGTTFGTVMSFTTLAAPTTTTTAATSITASSATLNGLANPNLLATTGWFRYSTTDPGTCDDSFGTRAPASDGTTLGSGSAPVAYSILLNGLALGTTYYYCAIAANAVGTSVGTVASFTTGNAPTVATSGASGIAATIASLEGSAIPNLVATTGWFRYSTANPGTCDDVFGTRAPPAGGVALGSGATATPYTQSLAGLAQGTTYYFCAIASNSVGTRFGAVLSFTTAGAPSVATAAASAATSNSATLNGSASPNQLAATGWFRYGTTDPGSCNDAFGSRAPVAGGSALGSGTAVVPFAEALTGLAPATTYYFCAIASNAAGTRFGSVLSFATPAAPVAETYPATGVTDTTATLAGAAMPSFDPTMGWYRYDTSDPGSCSDSFGTRAPAVGGTALGAGSTLVPYSQGLTGLQPGTTYYFCAIASNAFGTALGSVLTFTTTAPPTVTTVPASAVLGTSATLNGTANPNLAAALGWFRYSATDPGSCDDSFGTRAPAGGGSVLGAGGSALPYARPIVGLAPATTYYFCAIASNAAGVGLGTVTSFTTPAAPTVVTVGTSDVTSTGATLNASADPHLAEATGYFRYATTNPGTCDDAFGTRAPANGGAALGSGSGPVPYSQGVTGLTPATTYYYCAVASNVVGTGLGVVMSFTTPDAPSVTTDPATSVVSNAATLHGHANPHLVATTGWFRYATSNPGVCDDAFGTRAPASDGSPLGSGSSPVAYSELIAGLAPATTYYYCAIASNAHGTRFGAILSFTTTGPPVVTTHAATAVVSTAATLHGTAYPNLSAATGWFRYDTTDPGACDDTFGTRAPSSDGTALGAGGSAVDYSEDLIGLSPGTTYYFCALAQNQVGTAFGQILSFTTSPDLPIVTTNPPTDVSGDAAVLNGVANPNGGSATGWFRYDSVDPGSCDDAFGVRAPASGGATLGAGHSDAPYALAIAGLTVGGTYYYCALASNAAGTSVGDLVSFVAGGAPPTVTTEVATGVEATTATVGGTADPNANGETVGWFRLGDFDPGSCDDSFGVRVPGSGGAAVGAGTGAVPFGEDLTDLTPNATYFYCAAASNLGGAAFGEVLSFTTPAAPPTVATIDAVVSGKDVALAGTANPGNSDTTGWFRHDTVDPGACDDAFGTRAPVVGGTPLGAGNADVSFSEDVSGLAAGTHYFCAIGENAAGVAYGEVLTFDVATDAMPLTPAEASGCGCRLIPARGQGGLAAAVALLLLAVGRRRRRA
ncbi:MAG: hypothetical protein IT373_24895 [Polyangiaceae bacterium]|nr:hypothetical protein [Polyangiaceae bacterium]